MGLRERQQVINITLADQLLRLGDDQIWMENDLKLN